MGVFISPNNSAIMGSGPRHQLGVVSGFMAITRSLGQTVGVAVMGAIWVWRTAYYSGTGGAVGSTAASSVKFQIATLQDTFHVAAVLLATASCAGLWALFQHRRYKKHVRVTGTT